MSVTESLSVTPAQELHEELPPDPSAGSRQTAQPEPVECSDAQFAVVFKEGFLFGTPALYLIVTAVCMLGAPGHGWLLVAALWPALFAGWFFGGVVALSVHEWREDRRRQRIAARTGTSGRVSMRRTRTAVAH